MEGARVKKHNRQYRQMMALVRFYRRYAGWYLDVLRHYGRADVRIFANHKSSRLAHELWVLERSLPPEMVAWAQMNR